ncbi:hypothetical protein [Undibacterium umbellatum]|uniref:Transmembrane protein n=1 Tax=Undibacterium umbellatum TaxID=2762300 RepID=A0ABR6ZIP9_9BURK|nr:hypothetical protein [Undibacterium umbellatum]MBC3911584.1 hypothetical protein [Undibacterium umbellatum]
MGNEQSEHQIAAPSEVQIKTELDTYPQVKNTGNPGDSLPLPKVKEDLLNDGIEDQQSRRQHRPKILTTAIIILGLFTACLCTVVGTLSTGFYQAIQPDNIAKFVAVELKEETDKVISKEVDKEKNSSKSEKVSNASKESKASDTKNADEQVVAKEKEPIKVEAKIYGEIRDSMVPLVALVSILAVAIVVILGTMLKAAFAPYPNSNTEFKETEETSPVPVLEAIKGLVDSLKAALKSEN